MNNLKKAGKPVILFLLGTCLTLLGTGQAKAVSPVSVKQQEKVDTKAKAILDELSTKTKAYTTIKADFTLSIENKEKKVSENQTGKLQLKGNKYKLEIKGQDIISDNKTIWTYIKDANEVTVNDATPSTDDALNPSTIFTIYEHGFKYKFEKEEDLGNSTVQVINLYPTQPDKKKFHTVKLMIDKAKKQIMTAKIFMKDGSVYTYNIKNFVTNSEVPDHIFAFDAKAHPGVEIVDLRE